ncbi:MAG TPA: AEC family transporter, partial [Sedimentisphaerales bacterium]|nr:AEC family transporter [Sedimentisphaerales bacterium]
MAFLHIITDIILPIFLLISVGFAMDRKFRLDLDTLSKLNFYVFVPALLFVRLLAADATGASMLTVGLFTILQMALLFAISMLVYTHPRFRPSRAVLSMTSMFNNCGNYGIPMVIFAFPANPELLGPLAVIIAMQNLANFTFGIWLFERRKNSTFNILKGFAGVPVVYALAAAVLMRYFNLEPLPQIGKPLEFLSDGLVSIALITLGAQLSRSLVKSDPLP